MRGRERFAKWQRVLDVCSAALDKVPDAACQFGLESVRHTPGMLGFGLRYLLLKRLAERCGRVVAVYPGVYVLNVSRLVVGDHVSVHQMCYLECAGGLEIGSDVSIAHGVSIMTHEHDYDVDGVPIRDAPLVLRRVVIGDDVWIGAGARILGGVSIGRGAVIGAGAVVTRSVPEWSIAVGVPARVVGSRRKPSGVAM